MLRCILCVHAGILGPWWTHNKLHFVSSLAWDGFCQHKLRYVLGSRWHVWDLVNTCCDWFFIRAGMGGFRQHKFKYYISDHWHEIDLINSCWDVFLSWLEWKVCGQHMIRRIYYLRSHWMNMVNTRWDAFCVLACIYWVSSIHVVMHFVSSLAWDGFGQHMLWYVFVSSLALDVIDHHVLRCILCIPRHRMGLVKTNWDTFCGLAGIGWDWSTLGEVVLVSSLVRKGQHLLRYNYVMGWV